MIVSLRVSDLVFPGPTRQRTISLEVAPGEVVAAVVPRPEGAALARVVVGLAPPVSGRIEVGRRDVTDLPPDKRQIGYVPPGGALLPHLTLRQNIEYGLRRRETVRDVTREWVSTLVRQLELTGVLAALPHEVSGAKRLRAALARAAASLPEVLILELPGPDGGGDRLVELVPRMSPPEAPGVATLVCSADPDVLRGIEQRVSPREPAA